GDRRAAGGRRDGPRRSTRRPHDLHATPGSRSRVGPFRLHPRARGRAAVPAWVSTRGEVAARSGRCAKPPRAEPTAVRVTALAGGTGAAKLLRGLAACIAPRELTIVGNTGDDTEVWGLHVSPDLDTVTYALGGVLDVARGWGRAEETFRCREVMATLGAPAWFSLGDRDLAVHLTRTTALRAGEPLSAITARLS